MILLPAGRVAIPLDVAGRTLDRHRRLLLHLLALFPIVFSNQDTIEEQGVAKPHGLRNAHRPAPKLEISSHFPGMLSFSRQVNLALSSPLETKFGHIVFRDSCIPR